MSEVAVREPPSLYSCPAAARIIRSQMAVSGGYTWLPFWCMETLSPLEGPSFTTQGSWLSLY